MNRDIEDIFKEKFASYEAAPSADLFSKIQAKREQGRKRALWWYAAIIGFICLVTTVLMLPKKDSVENNIVKNESALNLPIEQTDETMASIEDEVASENDVEKDDFSVNKNSSSKSITNQPRTIDRDKTSKSAGTTPPESKIVNTELADRFYKIVAEKGIKNPDKSTLYTKDKMYEVGKRPEETYKQKELENDGANRKQNLNEAATNQQKTLVVSSKPDTIHYLENEPNDDDLPNNAHKLSKWSVQLSGGPSFATRRLQGNDKIIALRNETEVPLVSYTAEINAFYQLNQKWNLGIGAQYAKRNEAFNYTRETTIKQQIIQYDTFTVYQNPLPPRQLIVADTTYNYKVETANLDARNAYQKLVIPLSVERIFSTETNWSFYSKASLNAIIWQNINGLVLDGENAEIHNLEAFAKNRLSINGLALGVGVGYMIKDGFDLIIYPTANYQFQSVFNNSYALKQNEIALASSVGLRFKF